MISRIRGRTCARGRVGIGGGSAADRRASATIREAGPRISTRRPVVDRTFGVMVAILVPSLSRTGRNVVLGQLVLRVREDVDGAVLLDHVAGAIFAHREEGRLVADPRRLLHVVGHDHDRVVLAQLGHQLLDPERRDRVERGAGSSIRMTSGSTASARAMHSRCCCPPDSDVPLALSLSLTSSHSAARRRHRSTTSSTRCAWRPFEPEPGRDVVEDRHVGTGSAAGRPSRRRRRSWTGSTSAP